jgi:hypothetical protein
MYVYVKKRRARVCVCVRAFFCLVVYLCVYFHVTETRDEV